MGAVLSLSVEFGIETCCNCAVQYAIPLQLQHALSNEGERFGESFYCPNGHAQCYAGPSEATKLRQQLEAKQREAAQTAIQLKNVRDLNDKLTMRTTRAEKKLARVKNGVCPCCKRSFTALRRHMATKHPEFVTEKETA